VRQGEGVVRGFSLVQEIPCSGGACPRQGGDEKGRTAEDFPS